MPLPLTSTTLTEGPLHRYSSIKFFQIRHPCPNLFVCSYLSRYHGQNHSISLPGSDYLALEFPIIFTFLDLSLSHKFQNVYWHIRPCQWGDCILTYLLQILPWISYPASLLYFLSLKTPTKKVATMNNMKKVNDCNFFLWDLRLLREREDFSVDEGEEVLL